jgi:uncharacterized protein
MLDGLLAELIAELPAVMVTGPRAGGKTTTAARHAASVVRLDRALEAEAFRADPDVALQEYEEPILLDEWQEEPGVLGAVKRAVDDDPRPGRFLLTGSVRAELDAATWPGTGRVVRVAMYGMTVREQLGRAEDPALLDVLAAGDVPRVSHDPPDLRGYVELALRGGYPDPALRMAARARMRWLDGYVEQLLTRDATGVDPGRDPARLGRYLEAYALNTAGIAADATLFEFAGVNRRTAVAYERLSKAGKRHLVDPALIASILHVDAGAVLRDGDLLGRVLESFVVAQVRAELPVCASRPRLYHLREEHGRHEVDLLAELGAAKLVAFEVKAGAADLRAARHLVWLREELGDRFSRGVVFHTGPRAYELDDRIIALPICALWG